MHKTVATTTGVFRTRKEHTFLALVVGLGLLFAVGNTAMAATDSDPLGAQTSVQPGGRLISVTDIDFGSYVPTDPTPLNGVGDVKVRVTKGQTYEIFISIPRQMTLGAEILPYELYSDPGRTNLWMSGTGGDESYTSISNALFTHNIHGQVTPLMSVSPGVFTDTVTITLNF